MYALGRPLVPARRETALTRSLQRALTLSLVACGMHQAAATDGYFDPAWAGAGRIAFDGDVTNPGDSYASAIARGAGGNLLLVGPVPTGSNSYPWLGELQPNGQFSPSFGAADGTGRIDGCNAYAAQLCGVDSANAVAIQPDGRYVVATTDHLFRTTGKALALDVLEINRFTVNDAGGVVNATAALAIQSGTKILAAGYGRYSGVAANYVFGVVRLGSDMTLDMRFGAMKDAQQTTFAGGALPVVSAEDAVEIVHDIFLQASGRIVLAGYGYPADASAKYIEAAGLTANGLPDASYGQGGTTRLSWSYGAINGVGGAVMDSAGRTIVVGTAITSAFGVVGMLVTRLDANGSLDTSFGDALAGPGFSFNSNSECTSLDARAVALDSAGRILVAGTCTMSSATTTFAVERLRGDGTLDTSFGSNGFSFGVYAGGSTANDANAITLDASGYPIVAGSTTTGSTVRAGVARLTYDLIFTDTFGSAPRGCLPPACN